MAINNRTSIFRAAPMPSHPSTLLTKITGMASVKISSEGVATGAVGKKTAVIHSGKILDAIKHGKGKQPTQPHSTKATNGRSANPSSRGSVPKISHKSTSKHKEARTEVEQEKKSPTTEVTSTQRKHKGEKHRQGVVTTKRNGGKSDLSHDGDYRDFSLQPQTKSRHKRMVNGEHPRTSSGINDVSVKVQVTQNVFYSSTCTGTVVAPDKVITAAHCFSEDASKCQDISKKASQTTVYIRGKPHPVKEINHVSNSCFKANKNDHSPKEAENLDIAMLTLARPIQGGKCVPIMKKDDFELQRWVVSDVKVCPDGIDKYGKNKASRSTCPIPNDTSYPLAMMGTFGARGRTCSASPASTARLGWFQPKGVERTEKFGSVHGTLALTGASKICTGDSGSGYLALNRNVNNPGYQLAGIHHLGSSGVNDHSGSMEPLSEEKKQNPNFAPGARERRIEAIDSFLERHGITRGEVGAGCELYDPMTDEHLIIPLVQPQSVSKIEKTKDGVTQHSFKLVDTPPLDGALVHPVLVTFKNPTTSLSDAKFTIFASYYGRNVEFTRNVRKGKSEALLIPAGFLLNNAKYECGEDSLKTDLSIYGNSTMVEFSPVMEQKDQSIITQDNKNTQSTLNIIQTRENIPHELFDAVQSMLMEVDEIIVPTKEDMIDKKTHIHFKKTIEILEKELDDTNGKIKFN